MSLYSVLRVGRLSPVLSLSPLGSRSFPVMSNLNARLEWLLVLSQLLIHTVVVFIIILMVIAPSFFHHLPVGGSTISTLIVKMQIPLSSSRGAQYNFYAWFENANSVIITLFSSAHSSLGPVILSHIFLSTLSLVFAPSFYHLRWSRELLLSSDTVDVLDRCLHRIRHSNFFFRVILQYNPWKSIKYTVLRYLGFDNLPKYSNCHRHFR